MKKKTRFLLCGAFLYFFILPALFAQEREIELPASFDPKVADRAWQESISALRDSAETLTKENDRIAEENKRLIDEISGLEQSLKEKKQEAIQLIERPATLKEDIEEESERVKGLQKDVQALEKQLSDLSKENAVLKKQLSPDRKAESLAQKKRDAADRERQLLLDLKIKEAQPEKKRTILKAEIEKLEAQLLASREEEIKAREDLVRAKKSSQTPKALPVFKEEKTPASEIKALKKELDSSLAEAASLRRSRDSDGKENILARKAAEIDALESQNRSLEAELQEAQKDTEDFKAQPPEARNEDYRAAISALEEENSRLENRLFDLKESLASLRRENAIVQELVDIRVQAPEEDTNPQAIETEAMAYAHAAQGQYDQAIKKYEEALTQGGQKKNIYFNLGSIYSRLGNIEEAKRNYRNVLKIDPKDYEAKRNLRELMRTK